MPLHIHICVHYWERNTRLRTQVWSFTVTGSTLPTPACLHFCLFACLPFETGSNYFSPGWLGTESSCLSLLNTEIPAHAWLTKRLFWVLEGEAIWQINIQTFLKWSTAAKVSSLEGDNKKRGVHTAYSPSGSASCSHCLLTFLHSSTSQTLALLHACTQAAQEWRLSVHAHGSFTALLLSLSLALFSSYL